MKDKFDIIFISWDEDEQSFKEYFQDMPWKALPFSGKVSFPFSYRKEFVSSIFKIENVQRN